MIVGYARVSTDGQTLDAQQAALTQAGATQVFAEKISVYPYLICERPCRLRSESGRIAARQRSDAMGQLLP